MHQPRVLPVLQNAEIPQAQLREALVNEINRGVDIQRDRGLVIEVRHAHADIK